jgi:hypothetical protein
VQSEGEAGTKAYKKEIVEIVASLEIVFEPQVLGARRNAILQALDIIRDAGSISGCSSEYGLFEVRTKSAKSGGLKA